MILKIEQDAAPLRRELENLSCKAMTLHRAHVSADILAKARLDQSVELPAEVAHRLRQVVRVSQNEIVELFDGSGLLVRGVIGSDGTLRVQTISKEQKTGPKLLLAQAIVNQSKLEEIVENATQLGADGFILFMATHSVAKLTSRTKHQVERLRRIATDAARQSERSHIPDVTEPVSFTELLTKLKESNSTLFVGEPRESCRLTDALKTLDSSQDVILVIGPEGGFTDTELEQFKAIGAKIVRYAPYVLRTQTAGLVGLSIIQSYVR